jgi:protein arginine N-methyltransferase 1
LPVNKVDIIISEWMGYMLLYESMLDTVLYARDKWLTQDGLILPDKAVINLAAIEDDNYKQQKIHWWDDVYGIDMSCLKNNCLSEPLIDFCDKKAIISTICPIYTLDLYTVKKEDLDFSSKYELRFTKNDWLHGLVSWFDIEFDRLPNKVSFTTGPFNKETHWKQVIFYTKNDMPVYKGDEITGSFALRKSETNFRQLDIKISYHYKEEFNFVQLYKIK